MAPEVFARSRHPGYDHRADCFSLGVLLWALVCNRVPFGWAKRDIMDILLSVRDDPLPPGRSCVHFVTNLLNKDSSQRLHGDACLTAVCQWPWRGYTVC